MSRAAEFAMATNPDVDPLYDPYRRRDLGGYASYGGWAAPVAGYSTAQTGYGEMTTATDGVAEGVADAGAGDSGAIGGDLGGDAGGGDGGSV